MPNDHDTGLVTAADACAPCGLHEPTRVAYYDGKMLTARDLTAEQTYHIGMRHLGNMLLEGEGTVCGLAVEQHPEPGCQSSHLVLRRGMALTCCGEEVIVPQDTTIPFRSLIEASPALMEAFADGGQDLVVTLCREDRGTEQAPVLISDCCSDGKGQLPGRIAEGYSIQLEAVAPGSLNVEREVIDPDLKWVHSINTQDARPTATAIDEDRNVVYVVTHLDGEATIRGYDMSTHAQLLTLTNLGQVHDIVAPISSPWLFVAGMDEEGAGVIHLFERTPDHLAAPAKSISIPETGEGAITQISVSAVTGSLVALTLNGDLTPVLNAWSKAELEQANPNAFTLVGEGSVATDRAFRAGCRHIEISPNGQRIGLLLPELDGSSVYVTDLSAVTDGSLSAFSEAVADIKTLTGDTISEAYLSASSLRFSYDSAVLHVAGRHPIEGDKAFYRRLSIDDGTATEIGTPAQFDFVEDEDTFPAIYVAPDERWLYVSTATPPRSARDVEGTLAVYATKQVQITGGDERSIDPIQTISLDAQLSGGVLNARGVRMYLPGHNPSDAETDDEVSLIRGRVMVIEITEADIAGMFETAVDGCRTCDDHCSCVRLAHVTGYVYDAESPMRVVDADEDVAEEDVGRIDNLSHRPIVPSNVRLMEAILEIAARGVTAGPPGPRGDDGAAGTPGTNGIDGKSISAVEVVESLTAPDIREETDGTLTLLLPPAEEGERGPRGASIVEVRTSSSGTTPRLEPNGDDFTLVLPPLNSGGPSDPFEWPDREEYLFVEDSSVERGTVVGLDDTSSVEVVDLKLSEEVDNPDVLLLPSEPDDGFVLSGALEVRVHTWGSSDADNIRPGDNDQSGELIGLIQTLARVRTYQFSPVYGSVDEFSSDGMSLRIDLKQLWTSLFRDGKPSVRRARVEIVLHGSVLLTQDKPKSFDGVGVGLDHMKPSDTGGTWRTWIEVFGSVS